MPTRQELEDALHEEELSLQELQRMDDDTWLELQEPWRQNRARDGHASRVDDIRIAQNSIRDLKRSLEWEKE